MTSPVWNTSAGSLGTFPSLISTTILLSASPVPPATTLTYTLLSGSLPDGLTLHPVTGVISGTPLAVTTNVTYTFAVRATDNLDNIKDRTFSLIVSGNFSPKFITPTGTLLVTEDSTWVELPVEYSNPVNTNDITIRVVQGILPPGLEINSYGLIRGYADPPMIDRNLGVVYTNVTQSNSTTNQLSCLSTTGFSAGRPIIFSGTSLGGITIGQTYYIHSVISSFAFTISTTQNGPIYPVTTDTGSMSVTLPNVTVGQPTIRTFTFTLKLESDLGNDLVSYSITVKNQNTPTSQGGSGKPNNSRVPTILNTRPATYDLSIDPLNYAYYVLPSDPAIPGETYNTAQNAYIGRFLSGDEFSFNILGKDFDLNKLNYQFSSLPLGLIGDSQTGWVYGTPVIADNTISSYSFNVYAYKVIDPSIRTATFNFSFNIANNVIGDITWLTDSDLGQIYNGAESLKSVVAVSDVELNYRITSGALPPNLTLLSNGEITGVTAFEPTESILSVGDTSTFEFTVQAYSSVYSIIQSSKTFTLTVVQKYNNPTDTLYIEAQPTIEDREILASLLNNNTLIPDEYLYRTEDSNFGKATNVTYVHAYGIFASTFEEYVAAITINHYWKNLVLGSISTAVAKDENGKILYEVVYSNVIDNLINPSGVSVSKEVIWPRVIDIVPPTYLLYPNSLPDMRTQVEDVLGQEYNFNLYPLWMTSQQKNGSTLGFIPAWVICYCKPDYVYDDSGNLVLNSDNTPRTYAQQIAYNIENNWKDPVGNKYTLNDINFEIDKFTVNKSLTYDYDKGFIPPAWTGLPSATPEPNPIDSKDFYVLFPRKTILPK